MQNTIHQYMESQRAILAFYWSGGRGDSSCYFQANQIRKGLIAKGYTPALLDEYVSKLGQAKHHFTKSSRFMVRAFPVGRVL